MMQLRARSGASILAALVCSAMLMGVGAHPAAADHTSQVTAVSGLAYSYYSNVGLFGGPPSRLGYGQSAGGVATAASPSVACPAGGGSPSVTDADGARATYGPAVMFGGKWPAEASSAPPSGPLTSSIDCRLGADGYVTASTYVDLMPPGSTWLPSTGGTPQPHPGGVGPGPFIADGASSTCTVTASGRTASTTITNGFLETKYDASTQLPITTEVVPVTPPVNYTRSGTIDHVGDSYRIVFNEQVPRPDGSITVIAAHMYLLGPTAVGDLVIGSSTCGPVATSPVSHGTTFAPLTPARIWDTRVGPGPTGRVGPAGTRDVTVTGIGGVPTTGVTAVVLNLTAVVPTVSTWITAWPTGEAKPVASNLNVPPNDVRGNLVTVKVGAGGKVSFYNEAGTVDLIADVAGWYG